MGEGYASYSADLASGDYVLELINYENTPYGTIEVTVPEESDAYTAESPCEFKIAVVIVRLSNSNEGGEYFKFGEDANISSLYVASQQGETRVVGYDTFESYGISSAVFPVIVGDTFSVEVSPTELHPTYAPSTYSDTVSSIWGVAVNAILGYYIDYTITVPNEATLFVGKKLRHYVPFQEIAPKGVTEDGDTKTYTYTISNSDATCYYRISMPGVMTHAGRFTATEDKNSLVFTAEELEGHGTPDYYNHKLTDNKYGNVADILLNINERGHLCMNMGDEKQIVAHRTWQLIDTETNNYFVDPDFHYVVLNENFEPSDAVITIDEDGNITTKSEGTAIVQVTYDACYARGYNDSLNGDFDYWFGPKWSKIWAENTGLFIVTVGNGSYPDTDSFVPNFLLDNVNDREDKTIDSELDTLYYLESENGYNYSYKPQGAAKVELANPIVDSENNTLSYGEGFKEVSANEDGSYNLLLTYGRNIIRTTSTDGAIAYQVVSAKPCGYEITNVSNPGGDVYPGDKIEVQFHGFYHPTPKLSGVYNQSASIHYSAVDNSDGSLFWGSGQYTFAGNPKAQNFQIEIPYEFTAETYDMVHGAILVNGYGDLGGLHRTVNRTEGRNPNFNAEVTTEFWGSIPDVFIPVYQPTGGVKINLSPADADFILTNASGHTYTASENGVYTLTPGTYTYTAEAVGYFSVQGEFVVGTDVITKDVILNALAADDTAWDGESVVKPAVVSAEEAQTSEFNGMEGYYKVASGYELAWIKKHIDNTVGTTNLVLTNDVDLANYNWSSLGFAKSYSGTFEGNNHSILNMNMTVDSPTGSAFIYSTTAGSTVRNLSVYGEITNGYGDVTAGVIAYAGYGVYENLTNYANINGSSGVAGVIGHLYAPESSNLYVRNLVNHGNLAGIDQIGGVISKLSSYAEYNLSGLVNTGTINVLPADNVNTPTIGGLICYGFFDPGLHLSDSYNTGDIISEEPTGETGAIIGDLYYSEFSNTITRVYSTGKVPGNRPYGEVSTSEMTYQDVYLAATEDDVNEFTNDVTYLEGSDFSDGYVAWLLRESFGQELGVDATPVLDGAKVYRVTYTTSKDEETEVVIYTNGTLPDFSTEGELATWLTSEDGEPVTSVTEDSTLYVQYTVSGVNGINAEDVKVSNIYTVSGVALGTTSVDELPAGIYVVVYSNGEKSKVVK